MEVSLKQFAQDVTASGLLTADDLAAFQKELAASERRADAANLELAVVDQRNVPRAAEQALAGEERMNDCNHYGGHRNGYGRRNR